MGREYLEYIEQVLQQIHADGETKQQIRQSLTEHIEVLIERHGSIAYRHLTPVEQMAAEFNENLSAAGVYIQPVRPYWASRYRWPDRRRVSQKRIFNLPLYHFTDGYNPETGKFEIAKGIIAVGPIAVGGLALGGIGFGVISFSGLGIGVLMALGGGAIAGGVAIGGAAIGGLVALGGAAISAGLSFGGFALGHVAIGEDTVGKYVYNIVTKEGNAVEWFKMYLPYFAKFF